MKTIALIPARQGSKRVPDKNVRLLEGIPLFVWSIILAKHIEVPCFLSTDSLKYAKIAKENFCDVLIRPLEICTDDAGDFEVLDHAFKNLDADAILYLRPTTPFRCGSKVLEAMKEIEAGGENVTGLRSVEEMSESAFKCFMRSNAGFLIPNFFNGQDMTNFPNQKCPRTYKANGYVDIALRRTVEGGSAWGDRVIGFLTAPVIEIDTERDFWTAEMWARGRNVREEVVFK